VHYAGGALFRFKIRGHSPMEFFPLVCYIICGFREVISSWNGVNAVKKLARNGRLFYYQKSSFEKSGGDFLCYEVFDFSLLH
jgi:hypothetical protein